MCEETVKEMGRKKIDSTDETTYSTMRMVIMTKLEECTDEIVEKNKTKMDRIQKIVDQYGSIQAYKDYVENMRKQLEEDREAFLKKEREKKE